MNAFRARHLENALMHFEELTSYRQPLNLFLKQYFKSNKKLSQNDRCWINEQIFELIRWKGLLDFITPPPNNWPNRLKTFAISNRWRGHTLNTRLPAHVRCSFSEVLFRRIEGSFGTHKAMQVCNVLNEPAPLFLRVNILKTSRDKIYRFLTNKGVMVEKCVHSPRGLQLTGKQRLLDLPEYKKGFIEIQDESSQLVGFKVMCKPGDKVLDYCSGSGGKALVFGPSMENSGTIYLHEPREYMLSQAKIRLRHAGIRNYVLLPPSHPLHHRLRGCMDWVVVDVPCSGTAALRRKPDMKWNYSDTKALQYMKVGGKIVYITCSILDEENVEQVKYFCQKHGLLLSEAPFHALPQSKGMDGFFCATFERKSEEVALKE